MKQRQIIYASTIYVLASVQMLPCCMIFCGTVTGVVIGFAYTLLLRYFWSKTKIGKWFFRELWRSALRIEKLLFPE